jgi:hypothetical protein
VAEERLDPPGSRYGPIQPVALPDVFAPSIVAFQRLFGLALRDDRWAAFRHRADEIYELLLEVALIWERIGSDRVEELQAARDEDELGQRLGVKHYTLGTGEHPRP